MRTFEVTRDRRVLLNGAEVDGCLGFEIQVDAGRDPEVVLRVSVDKINIDGYMDAWTTQRESLANIIRSELTVDPEVFCRSNQSPKELLTSIVHETVHQEGPPDGDG